MNVYLFFHFNYQITVVPVQGVFRVSRFTYLPSIRPSLLSISSQIDKILTTFTHS